MAQDTATNSDELPIGTALLLGQYRILQCLSQGGFGITYVARDSLGRDVVLKECFAAQLCTRDALDVRLLDASRSRDFDSLLKHFKKEAYRLAALDHSGIVGVHQIFAENQTAYMAMDYCRGDDLFTVIEDTPERMSRSLLGRFLRQALLSVQYTHDRGFLHRDLAPDNFLIDGNDHVVLIDYGSAADMIHHDPGQNTRLLAVKDGFSPYEFYATGDAQDASSDLYSLGATLCYLITGDAPPNSQHRLASTASGEPDPFEQLTENDWDIDQPFLDLVNQALSIHQRDRIGSATEWLERLVALDGKALPGNRYSSTQEIEPTIAQLVTETNTGLSRGLPQSMRPRVAKPDVTQKQKQTPPQPVDIFGNPIEDVEAYLREQDRLSRRKRVRAPRLKIQKSHVPVMKAAPESSAEDLALS
ncbi:MAG: serine/threonine-protein kinase [Pseudomonadota bacterium]